VWPGISTVTPWLDEAMVGQIWKIQGEDWQVNKVDPGVDATCRQDSSNIKSCEQQLGHLRTLQTLQCS
jgi:hypothetical protein